MDPRHEQAIRQAAALAFHLAAIEHALRIAEACDAFPFLADTIRWHIGQVETIAGDDFACCRRLLHGNASR